MESLFDLIEFPLSPPRLIAKARHMKRGGGEIMEKAYVHLGEFNHFDTEEMIKWESETQHCKICVTNWEWKETACCHAHLEEYLRSLKNMGSKEIFLARE